MTKHAYVLEKAYEAENNLRKDLSEFTLEEIQIMMHSWKFTTLAEKKDTIKKYIDFFNKTEENPLDTKRLKKNFGTVQNFCNQLVQNKSYLSKDEIIRITNDCKNKQDAVVVRLLFEGIHFHEMLELTIDDVIDNVFPNYIIVGDRNIDVDKECIDLVKSAYKEYYYEPYGSSSKRYDFRYMPSGKKIIKRVDSNKGFYEDRMQFLHVRLKNIKKFLNIKFSLNQVSIIRAGMLYRAKILFENSNKDFLTASEIQDITLRFGYQTYESFISILTKTAVESIYGEFGSDNKNGQRYNGPQCQDTIF